MSVAAAEEVFVKDGDVYVKADAAAPALRLTTQGDIQRADLTPDGAWVLFYSLTRGMIIDGGNGQAHFVKAHIVRLDGKHAQLLWSASPLAPPDTALDGVITQPAFSPDASKLYFVDKNQVHQFDLKRGSRSPLCAGFTVDVIEKGRWAGYLAVMQQSTSVSSQLWLVDHSGKRIQAVSPLDPSNDMIASALSHLRQGLDLPSAAKK